MGAVIADLKKQGRHSADVDPMATAGVLVAMLAHVSSHHLGFEFGGVRTGDLRTTMARIVHWSVTGQKPPT